MLQTQDDRILITYYRLSSFISSTLISMLFNNSFHIAHHEGGDSRYFFLSQFFPFDGKMKNECGNAIEFETLGKPCTSKTDEFSEKFRRGEGGGIFNPKIYIAKFGPLNRAFSA